MTFGAHGQGRIQYIQQPFRPALQMPEARKSVTDKGNAVLKKILLNKKKSTMKKTFLFLCGLIMSLSAFAQTSVTVNEPHMTRDALKTIIKMRPNDFYATITCSNSETAVTFIHSSRLM